jgi:hypothetical protein
MARDPQQLKLAALDNEDLVVLSAHAQDATVRPGDIVHEPDAKRLLVPINRFAWETKAARRKLFPRYERRNTVLHIDGVTHVASRGLERSSAEAVLPLLSITHEDGAIVLAFGGGAVLRASVEAIEVRLADLGGAWQTRKRPRHTGSGS